MKKTFLLSLCVMSFIAAHAVAFDCTDGAVLTGVNGKQYCQSRIRLVNWYTAFTWCSAHNMQLATMHEICDIDSNNKWDGSIGELKCLNIIGAEGINDAYLASATPYSNGSIYYIMGTTKQGRNIGDIRTTPKKNGDQIAVCKMF